MIPWRVRKFVSDTFPLLYYLARNRGTQGNSREYWDAYMEQRWDDRHEIWPTKNELLASLIRPDERVVDVGCGNGSILRHLKRLGYRHLHGVEVSQYAIRRLGGEGIKMHPGVLPAIPLPDASFDVVIASQVLEDVIRRRRFVKEIVRVLAPGGRAFILVPDDCLGPIDASEHVIKYDARSLRRFLEPYFTILSLESIRDVNHEIPILFAQLQPRRAGRESAAAPAAGRPR